jgi:hypothetical protein
LSAELNTTDTSNKLNRVELMRSPDTATAIGAWTHANIGAEVDGDAGGSSP